MKWVRCGEGDFRGDLPSPRSGHSAVRIRKTHVVVFGGLFEKKFLQDLAVLDTENNVWFRPEVTGSGSDGVVGPSPRAFHVAISIDCNMFVFGGRSGRKRLGDLWVLDTDTWQWSELTGYGESPSPRDFASGAFVGDGKIVIYGGWDGSKWLSDVYVLNTLSLDWRQLPVTGPVPPPRCGHTVSMVEKRLLVFGGRGGGGPVLGDLWALKGLFDEEREPPAWTNLKLPGSSPAPRCGHSTTAGGLQLLVFGGHGTAGWLTRYDIYHNDCIVLDRASVQWKRLPVSSEPPPARAYHSLTQIGSRFLLLGGYDGKLTFGDGWWLVPEDDPIGKRAETPSPRASPASAETKNPVTHDKVVELYPALVQLLILQAKEDDIILSPLNILRTRLGLPPVPAASEFIPDEYSDHPLLELSKTLAPSDQQLEPALLVKFIRDHWLNCEARALQLKELDPLVRDCQRLIATLQKKGLLVQPDASGYESRAGVGQLQIHRFYHLRNSKLVKMSDIPSLLSDYKQLLHMLNGA